MTRIHHRHPVTASWFIPFGLLPDVKYVNIFIYIYLFDIVSKATFHTTPGAPPLDSLIYNEIHEKHGSASTAATVTTCHEYH